MAAVRTLKFYLSQNYCIILNYSQILPNMSAVTQTNIYTQIYKQTHTHPYTNKYTNKYIHTDTQTNIQTNIYTHVHKQIYKQIYTYRYTNKYTNKYIHTQIHKQIHIMINKQIHIHIYIYRIGCVHAVIWQVGINWVEFKFTTGIECIVLDFTSYLILHRVLKFSQILFHVFSYL